MIGVAGFVRYAWVKKAATLTDHQVPGTSRNNNFEPLVNLKEVTGLARKEKIIVNHVSIPYSLHVPEA